MDKSSGSGGFGVGYSLRGRVSMALLLLLVWGVVLEGAIGETGIVGLRG
jgi:hypothetical protein